MKNEGKIFGIPMSLGGVHLISGIAHICVREGQLIFFCFVLF